MSESRRRRRRKKKSGCGCVLVFLLCIVLVVVILAGSGVISTIRTDIEKYIYPLKYEQIILEASEEYGFEPEFICGVIYTESKFRLDAESHVGAQGLMQILPETFQWLAQKRGENLTLQDMNTPEVSIDYGCYYLRLLTDTYGDIYTACAAYNAGNVVSTWLSDPAYSSDGVTLSSIPYEETSEYVSRIKSAQQMYEKLYFSE